MVSSKCCQVESPSPFRFLAALMPPCAHTEVPTVCGGLNTVLHRREPGWLKGEAPGRAGTSLQRLIRKRPLVSTWSFSHDPQMVKPLIWPEIWKGNHPPPASGPPHKRPSH